MDMPSEYMRREEVSRSGWPEERASRLEGMEDFGGRRDPDARFGMNAGAPSAAGRSLFDQGDDIEGSRPPVRYDITGSRYGLEAGLPENRAGGRGGRIPDLRDISVAKPLQHTRPRDPFQEETGLQGREWQNDPRHISQTKSAERLFDGFSGEKFAPDRKLIPPQGEEWPASGRVFGDRGQLIEDPREQFTVKCTNFPCTFNYKEVRRFFSGCEIPREGLKLVNDRSGSRTGTAYVRFMNSRAVSTAMGMNGRMAQDCKVRVERCSLEEYNSVNDGDVSSPRQRSRSPIGRKHASDDQPGVYYFVAKKLPPKVDRADMKKFFGKFRIAADGGPFMELAPNNSPTGNALVAIEKLRNPVEVISVLHRSVLNGANVEVISVNKSEYDERTKRCRQTKSKERNEVKSDAKPKDNPKSDKEIDADKRSFCVHVRGIPYNANATNIEDFFRGLDIPVNGIRIVLNREGRAAGDAFVEFTNSVDQKKALEKDKQHMGHRYIEVRPISRQSMINEHRALQKQCGGPPVNDDLPNRNPPDDLDSNLAVSMQNLHPNTQLEDILDFFRGHRPIVDTIKLQYKDGKPTGDGLVAFPTQQEAENAVRSKNRHFLLGRLITLSVWSKK
jgi:RNA recognition motif-containing protein